jgi:SAM-dependent methyltransferase
VAIGDEVSWSGLQQYCRECFQVYGTIHDVPIVDLHTELKRVVGSADRVLDFGAGSHQPMRNYLKEGAEYFTVDADPAGGFDFAELSDVPTDLEPDLVTANQVLEHIPVVDDFDVVREIFGLLRPGGRLLATVPNTAHPVRQWDPTHVTAWGVHDFYGLFRVCGFEVETLARYGKRKLTWRPIRRMIVKAVAKEFRVDWMDSLLVIARKPAE